MKRIIIGSFQSDLEFNVTLLVKNCFRLLSQEHIHIKRGFVKFWRGLLAFLIFIPFGLFGFEKDSLNEKMNFLLTVPKSGTQLFRKLLMMIRGNDNLYFTNIGTSPYDGPDIPDGERYLFNHAFPGFSAYRELATEKCRKVILIRDPRDAFVAMAMHILRFSSWMPLTPKELIQEFFSLPESKRISYVLTFPYLGLSVFYKEAIEWIKDPDTFVLRFEDIIGPQGGGDRLTQEKTITALAAYLECPISEEKVISIADSLFGGTQTFRKGQIGSWIEHFTEQDKDLFKSVFGNELIELGYEMDHDW